MPRFITPAPRDFSFRATVESHGWRMLPPYSWDPARQSLEYIAQARAGGVFRLWLREAERGVEAELPDGDALIPELESELVAAVRRMLNLDWDLGGFYRAMRAHEGYGWLEAENRGRLLIAPSLWEDLAKVLLTTNCSWAQTVNMSRQLCQLGRPHPSIDGSHAFPSPHRIADMSFDDFAEAVRAGYRSAYLYELARKIADGELDLRPWLELDGEGFFQAVKSLKGFGDYAAGTLARMYGHFDKIAIDTACHAMFARRHNGGAKGNAKQIEAHYERFGRWRGLVAWMDVMRDYGD